MKFNCNSVAYYVNKYKKLEAKLKKANSYEAGSIKREMKNLSMKFSLLRSLDLIS